MASVLERLGCKKIAHGPTEYSVEFRIDSDAWNGRQWGEWHHWMLKLEMIYGYSLERSCLPRRLEKLKNGIHRT